MSLRRSSFCIIRSAPYWAGRAGRSSAAILRSISTTLPTILQRKETLSAANAFNEKIVEEGIVLLKNEDALPIPTPESDQSVSRKPKLSVFGHNSINLVYGGSGSAGGDGSEGASTIYDSLQAAGYEYNPVLKSFYESSAAGEVRDTPTMGDNTRGRENRRDAHR